MHQLGPSRLAQAGSAADTPYPTRQVRNGHPDFYRSHPIAAVAVQGPDHGECAHGTGVRKGEDAQSETKQKPA